MHKIKSIKVNAILEMVYLFFKDPLTLVVFVFVFVVIIRAWSVLKRS